MMEKTLDRPLAWPLPEKILFRFFFIFFLLFIVIENNGAYPFWGLLMKYPQELLHTFIPWIGKHILHLSYDITVFTNGSGDTTYDYVIVLTIFAVALAGMVIWSLLDRSRSHYTGLCYWLTVAVRFYVGLMLINYGLVKVVKLQFPSPGLFRLTQFYGDSSPMGLAWTFLGFSDGYNLFMGLAEVAAVLLLFRRTMTVGAIITLMTTANVMAVNYFYDVPVKILSTMLVSMTLFLLLHDAGRLFKFFFKGEQVSLPEIDAPVIKEKWIRITKQSFKFLVIGFALIYGAFTTMENKKQYGDRAPKPKLYGLYTVETYVIGNDTLPPLTTDTDRWKQLMIEWEQFAQVRYMNDSVSWFQLKVDTVAQKMNLTFEGNLTYVFQYKMTGPNDIELTGKRWNIPVSVLLKRREIRLTRRGFRWINEYPYNR